VLAPGSSRKQIAHTLNAAYADGLLSHDTLIRRLDELFKARLIDPRQLVGDLTLRTSGRGLRSRLLSAIAVAIDRVGTRLLDRGSRLVLLALDWNGTHEELLIGRHRSCDVVLADPSVSRRHARVFFRDGSWVLQDLESTNGTVVNGVRVGRCELRPGDRLLIGDQRLQID